MKCVLHANMVTKRNIEVMSEIFNVIRMFIGGSYAQKWLTTCYNLIFNIMATMRVTSGFHEN